MSRRANQVHEGFSLAEMIIVIVLILVLALLVIPRLFCGALKGGNVPDLAMLSVGEAEDLCQRHLELDAVRRYDRAVPAGLVIPGSQIPRAGTKVAYPSKVLVAISKGRPPGVESVVSVLLQSPCSGETCGFQRRTDGRYWLAVTGRLISSANTSGGIEVLLWIRPVNPTAPMPGWYLQQAPARIKEVKADRGWRGECLVGQPGWPAEVGDVVDVAVSVVGTEAAKQIRTRAQSGPMEVLPSALAADEALAVTLSPVTGSASRP